MKVHCLFANVSCRVEWQPTVGGFNFLGGSSIEDLQVSCDAIPDAGGVYILKRTPRASVRFLEVNPGGRFKGRDPTVPVSRLEQRWIAAADVVYIGKAGGDNQRASLRSRIRSFMQFGLGKPCSHWGGRCIWQLADARTLRVFWAVCRTESRRPLSRDSSMRSTGPTASCPLQIYEGRKHLGAILCDRGGQGHGFQCRPERSAPGLKRRS